MVIVDLLPWHVVVVWCNHCVLSYHFAKRRLETAPTCVACRTTLAVREELKRYPTMNAILLDQERLPDTEGLGFRP